MYNYIHEQKFVKTVDKTKILKFKLDWNKILLRVEMLLNQIFIATKQHNLNRIHVIQNYMINSSEVKIFILQHIIPELYNLYYFNKNKFYLYNKEYDISELQILLKTQEKTSKTFTILKLIVKQNLVYICTKPVFDARSTTSFRIDRNMYKFNFSHDLYCIKNKYIKRKLSMPSYLKSIIYKSIDDISYIDLSKFYKSRYNKNLDNYKYLYYIDYIENINFLVEIVNKIMLNDYTWYRFSAMRQRFNNENYNKRFKNQNNYALNFLKLFKHHLKLKIFVDKFKLSSYIFSKSIQKYSNSKLDYLYKTWYRMVNTFISIYLTEKCNKFLNQAIHIIKKQYKIDSKNFNNKLYHTNLLLNKESYLINIKKYYKSNIKLSTINFNLTSTNIKYD
uniref:Reverse transcriptase N-terminal domain-containing protein n=1 Tax=Kapraunia schneideri TaxID=717899 RepID=A0A1Z1MT58_9FLOR|nr:hypothetical protein [Kapraunia schneideri]ARW68894.1 hypothetical protein [Kapraunia schneideri]